MNKNDLIASVSEIADLSKADATKAVDAVFDTISNSLREDSEIRLVGFGTFSVANRKASTGRNPRTGEPISIPSSNRPKFKPGTGLKAAVNFGGVHGTGGGKPGRVRGGGKPKPK